MGLQGGFVAAVLVIFEILKAFVKRWEKERQRDKATEKGFVKRNVQDYFLYHESWAM